MYTIGNSSEEIYLSLIKARYENKKVLFLTPFNLFYFYQRDIQCNELIKIRSKYSVSQRNIFVILLRIIFSFFVLFCRIVDFFLNKFFNITDSFFRDNAICPRLGISKIYNPYNGDIPDIEHNTQRYSWERAFIRPLNLSKSFSKNIALFSILGIKQSKYVCLHVRSSDTYDDFHEAIERNADINNYYLLINFLIKNGYKVVRMGDPRMPKLKKINGLFDYAHSNFNNKFNDQCLIANCSFYIGTTSGIWGLAWLFEKDMLVFNNPSWHYSSPKSNDIDLYKLFYDKKNKKTLKISEWISNHYGALHFTKLLDKRYKPIENSPNDLCIAVQNYLLNKRMSPNQSLKIKKLIRASALKYIRMNLDIPKDALYRFYLMSYLAQGNLDKSFYKKFY